MNDIVAVSTIEAMLNEAEAVNVTAAQATVNKAKKQAKTKKTEAAAQATPEPTEVTIPEITHVTGELSAMIAQIDDDKLAKTKHSVESQFEQRLMFEESKSASDRKKDLLKSYAKRLTNESVVKVLAALDFDAGFVNQQRGANRFNVYAVDKVADIAAALAGAGMRNKVNDAVTRSLFAARAHGLEFTGVLAAAAVSDKVRVGEHIKKVLVRHTVSESTVDTQLSSTMSALRMFGVVENVGSRNAPVYRLTDTPQTRALEERMAA